jgi:hypothetical protein
VNFHRTCGIFSEKIITREGPPPMAAPNPHEPFPDLSLPERQELVPVKPSATPAKLPMVASQTTWRVGDRVLAPWEPIFLYVGEIARIENGRALIEFDDGDSGHVPLERLKPVVVPIGHKLLCRRGKGRNYYPATVREFKSDVQVEYEDGTREWTTLAAIRFPCASIGPATEMVSAMSRPLADFHPGDRVWAPWMSGVLFVGTVDRIQEPEVHIHFADGDHGWVRLEQLIPFRLPVGLRVMGRWRMGNAYYPGVVAEVQGERVYVQYDDGDREWTKPAALALPCEPFGPDARPTKTAFRMNWGWLVAIAVGVGIAMLRGCR